MIMAFLNRDSICHNVQFKRQTSTHTYTCLPGDTIVSIRRRQDMQSLRNVYNCTEQHSSAYLGIKHNVQKLECFGTLFYSYQIRFPQEERRKNN